MKLKELIEQLSKFDPEIEVVIYDRLCHDDFHIDFVTDIDLPDRKIVGIAFSE
jgi:hypothetical protein